MTRSLKSWPYVFTIIAVLALVAVFARELLPTTAQDNGAPNSPVPPIAFLSTGTCGALDESRYELTGQSGTSGGGRVGSTAAAVVTYSLTQISARLDDFVAAPHAIVVPADPGNPTEWTACGEIGGFVDDDGLPVGLRATNGSGLAGIAILWDDGDAVEVELYLADGLVQTADAAPDA